MLEPVTLMGQKRCTKDSECSSAPFFACRLELPSFGCGGAAPLRMCNSDTDCAPGICQNDSCGGSQCAPACTSTSCASTQRCEVGRCVFKRCDEAGAGPCGDGYDCAPASTPDPSGCRAQQCDAGFHCPVNRDCDSTALGADVHGCVTHACVTAADCDCGSCVNGSCAPYPGACFNISPPP
jgi:hypothetical protein